MIYAITNLLPLVPSSGIKVKLGYNTGYRPYVLLVRRLYDVRADPITSRTAKAVGMDS